MIRPKRITIGGIILVLFIILALGMPLWAGEKDVHKGIRGETEKVIKPEKRVGTPSDRVRLPGPKINEFSCESLTYGYNYRLFLGGRMLSVNFNIYASQGLSSFEITFRGHRVHHVRFGGLVSSRSVRDLRLDLSPHRPARSGTYTLEAKVVDRRGKVATKSIRLRVDMEPPTITSIRPPNGSTVYVTTNPGSITYEIEASDHFSGVKKVVVEVDMVERYEDSTPPYRITVPNVRVSPDPERCYWAPDSIMVEDNEGNYSRLMYNECELCVVLRPMRLDGSGLRR